MEETVEDMANRDASPERGLWLRARYLKDARAAEELWNRSFRSTQWLTAIMLELPDLYAKALRGSTEVPVMMSLTPSSACYYKKLAKHLKKHCLGADSGLSTGENSRWGGKSRPAELAYLAFTTIQILRGRSSIDRFALSLVSIVRAKNVMKGRTSQESSDPVMIEHPDRNLVERALELPEFGRESVKQWCDLCIDILDATIEPGLKPGKQGRRKKGAEPVNVQNEKSKALRDQIRARIRDMVSAADKRHC